jgi:hypothetical protein
MTLNDHPTVKRHERLRADAADVVAPHGWATSASLAVPPSHWWGSMNDFFIDESCRRESQPALGRTIRVLRERQEDLTPTALAERAKVDVHLLEQIEAGEGGDFNTITYLRRALGVSAKEFAELYAGFVREEEGG